jgi:ribosomal protein S18 acetylase RimI-like enzyme
VIRSFLPEDADALASICLRTAAAGGDATGVYSSDELMPDVFVRPYLAFEPALALVVEGATGSPEGYIVGAGDTRAFVEWFREQWLPVLAERYVHVDPPTTVDEVVRHLGFVPERMLIPELDDYPAHLHIDLLPSLQGQGWGRRLIDAFVASLSARGIPGVHLAMDPANTAARAFYDRLGFTEVPSSGADETRLGMRVGSASL